MSDEHLDGSGRPGPEEGAAERLFARVRDACAEADGLPGHLEAGLRVALGGLAADPELARLLTLDPLPGGADDAWIEVGRELVGRFGALLRDAAAADPRASREPDFVAPFVIDGVRFQIARLVLAGETSDLLELVPGTLEGLLAYWFEPGRARALSRAAIARR
jgi:hypothetical protein